MSGLAEDIVRDARRKGIKLWAHEGELRYQAPKGALSQFELQRLKSSKQEILAHLEIACGANIQLPKLEPRQSMDPVPLTYSQLTHLQSSHVREHASVRQVATAVHLHCSFQIESLSAAAFALARRHDALRTTIERVDGALVQRVSPQPRVDLEAHDLTLVPESQQAAELQRLFERFILEPVDLARGPLWGLLIAQLAPTDHVLLVAMEHAISDAASVNLLLRELLAFYENRGEALPALSIQYVDYAAWQRRAADVWYQAHGRYWERRLAAAQRVRFPGSRPSSERTPGRGMVPLLIEPGLKRQLMEWCRARRTTLAMSVFTAYVALVLRWCATDDAVFRYQIDGRSRPELQGVIGYFASLLHLRIQPQDQETFADLLQRVTREYCNAYEHADHGYVDAHLPKPDFSCNTTFNWVPQAYGRDILDDAAARPPVTGTLWPFTNPVFDLIDKDSEPMVLLFDTDDAVAGGLYFSRDRFERPAMEAFAEDFSRALNVLLHAPESRIADLSAAPSIGR